MRPAPRQYFQYLGHVISRKPLPVTRARSVMDIDYETFFAKGIRLFIFDADDTLTHDKAPISPEVYGVLQMLRRKGVHVALLSNCGKKRRRGLASMTKELDVEISNDRFKPHPSGYRALMQHYRVDPKETAMVGDRIGTDMWGAYLAGIPHRILVTPFTKISPGKQHPLPLRALRRLERYVTKLY